MEFACSLQDRHRLFRSSGATEITIRDCDSLNKTVTARRVACLKMRSSAPNKFFRIETTFSECDRESAFAAIVRAFYQTFANQISHSVLDFNFMRQIDAWRRAKF